MKYSHLLSFFFLILFLTSFACTAPAPGESTDGRAVSSPEAQGISSRAILDFVEALDREMPDEIHSLMLRRHGKVVAKGWWAPYSAETPHMLYSLSKSFTSTAIGMAVDEGLISLDDPVISFFPEDLPGEVSSNLAAMRIRDLLRMNTGHEREPGRGLAMDGNWVRGFLAAEVRFKPGTHFVYNSFATYMCSAIIQKVSGETLLDFLTPRLFEPLGIKNPTWETDPEGINTGGWGLAITTEDISRFGQLYLQKGNWEGEQLVSEAWVEEASKIQSSNGSNPNSDWDQGYGYQFWRCRHNLYRGDGAFGQFCIVMPGQDAVLAITSGTGNMQKVMDLAWEHLLPAMKEESLPEDEDGLELLNTKLSDLAIGRAEGAQSSSLAADVYGRKYDFAMDGSEAFSIGFDFESSPVEVYIQSGNEAHTLRAGYQTWEMGNLKYPGLISDKVAVSGAWTDEDQYRLRLVYYETPYIADYIFRFKEDVILLDREFNVSFGSVALETLRGQAVD